MERFNKYICGPNDGGIKRGDSSDTGDDEARPSDEVGRGGSGVRGTGDGPAGQPTVDPSSLGGGVPTSSGTAENEEDLVVHDENDPNLGLTDKEEYW
jgi:hypothetical protein